MSFMSQLDYDWVLHQNNIILKNINMEYSKTSFDLVYLEHRIKNNKSYAILDSTCPYKTINHMLFWIQ